MPEYQDDYKAVFPLWCELDILDAHDYREELVEYAGLPDFKSFSASAFACSTRKGLLPF